MKIFTFSPHLGWEEFGNLQSDGAASSSRVKASAAPAAFGGPLPPRALQKWGFVAIPLGPHLQNHQFWE